MKKTLIWSLSAFLVLFLFSGSPPYAVASTNLLQNISFETASGSLPAHWNKGRWGTNTTKFLYKTGGAYAGTKYVAVSMSSYTSGDAKWYADPVRVQANATYKYGDHYKANVTTRVVAVLISSTGETTYSELTSAPASSVWGRYVTQFTTLQDTYKVTIYHMIDRVGTLKLDGVNLSLISSNNDAVSILNPSVEEANSSGMPANWVEDSWGNHTASFQYVSGDAHAGSKSLKVTVSNYTSGDAMWYFKPIENLVAGKEYDISAWYKTNTHPRVVVHFVDTSGNDIFIAIPRPLVQDGADTTWQKYKSSFFVPTGIKSATVLVLISHNGWLQTDDYAIALHTTVGFQEPLISLVFDDGFESVYTNALPLLNSYSFTSTQYLISGKLSTSGYMTPAMVEAFLSQGSEVGSHSATHADLTTISGSQVTEELTESQARLRELFGSSVAVNFASPFGAYSRDVVAASKQFYNSHVSIDTGYNTKDEFDAYNIRVQNITNQTTSAEFSYWVAQAKKDNTWLVIVYHSIGNDDDDFTTTVSNLDAQLGIVKASGVKVKTVQDALSEVKAQLS